MPKPTKATKVGDINKAWNRIKTSRKPYREKKNIAKAFLIVCEGQNTEPEYFKSFPIGNADVRAFGLGVSKTALVDYALRIIESEDPKRSQDVWVVFDMDIKPDQVANQKEDVNKAVDLAERNGIKVAFSNDAFELWFVLHYQHLASQITRNELYQILSAKWDCNYVKNGKALKFCRANYRRLQEDSSASQKKAIANAKKLEKSHRSKQPADRNPYTSVYLLVHELNKYLNDD